MSLVAEKDPRIVRNIMEDKTLMSIAWQIAKGMEHLANMKVDLSRLFGDFENSSN